jgi:ABC-type sulfate transport system permease component
MNLEQQAEARARAKVNVIDRTPETMSVINILATIIMSVGITLVLTLLVYLGAVMYTGYWEDAPRVITQDQFIAGVSLTFIISFFANLKPAEPK